MHVDIESMSHNISHNVYYHKYDINDKTHEIKGSDKTRNGTNWGPRQFLTTSFYGRCNYLIKLPIALIFLLI